MSEVAARSTGEVAAPSTSKVVRLTSEVAAPSTSEVAAPSVSEVAARSMKQCGLEVQAWNTFETWSNGVGLWINTRKGAKVGGAACTAGACLALSGL
jgi:hypothetical protein